MRIAYLPARVGMAITGTARAVCLCWFVPCRQLLRAGGGGTAGLGRAGGFGWSVSVAAVLVGWCPACLVRRLLGLWLRLLRRSPLVLVFR